MATSESSGTKELVVFPEEKEKEEILDQCNMTSLISWSILSN